MKLITALLAILINLPICLASTTDEWVILNEQQRATVGKDECAKVAVDAAAGLVSKEIKDAGIDYPDHLYLRDLYTSVKGQAYAITFQNDSTIMVTTQIRRSKCRAKKVSRFEVEL